VLHLMQGKPNPNGAEHAKLLLLVGDPAAAPIEAVIPAEGLSVPPVPDALAERPFRLCLLHCNDLHGHVSRITSHGDRPIFSRMVGRLRQLRQQVRPDPRTAVLFLSAGDDLMGAVFGELLGSDPQSYVAHAGYRLYSAAGLDAGVLGNHDLDMGLDLLACALRRDVRFPMLSANLAGCPQLSGLVYPAAILVVSGLRVGIVGLTTRGEVKQANSANLCMADPLLVAHNLIPALRPLCDVLIVLSHLGRCLAASTATVLDTGDVELAESLPAGSIDLIVGGHTHEPMNENGLSIASIANGVPIVQAGSLGRFLGEVDLRVGQRVTLMHARLSLVEDLPLDEGFEREAVRPLLEEIQPLLSRSLGSVTEHPDLSTTSVRAGFAAGESAFANFVTDALVARCRAAGYAVSLAAIDASCLHAGLEPGGTLTFGDWFDVMPYADTIRLHQLSSENLRDLLRDNARRADRPGEPHIERGFLQFSSQVRYTIELGHSRGQAQATNITVDHRPLERQTDRTFLVACTSFLREAAHPWERYASRRLNLPVVGVPADAHVETDLLVRDEMIAYIREHGGVTAEAGARRDGRLRIR
jgi:2',3'-cyclic-nucleotide 2'-phosphodiesterase (5'-nucleotidase family)